MRVAFPVLATLAVLGGVTVSESSAAMGRPHVLVILADDAIYHPPWKLVDPESPRLYQIVDDPLEEEDVAGDHPKIVAALVAAALAWPRGPESTQSLFDVFLDPDSIGGSEDGRAPWADG